jgi:ribose transport system substrate-binding protein
MKSGRVHFAILALFVGWVGVLLAGCDQKPSSKEIRPKLVFITAGTGDFWNLTRVGAEAGAKDYQADIEILTPATVDEQKRMVQDCLARGVDGIAISTIDPASEAELVRAAAAKVKLVTHDAQVKESKRIAHVGTDHYDAGRLGGTLMKDALPGGGTVVILAGSIDRENDRRRRQGLIDELMDRPHNPDSFDKPDAPIEGAKFQVVETLFDASNTQQTKLNVRAALTRHRRLGAIVGLSEAMTPAILEALGARAGKEVEFIAFDATDDTLLAIRAGRCFGTVVGNPYRGGYESIRILAGVMHQDANAMPPNGVVSIPPRLVKKNNVEEFIREKTAREASKPAR